MSYSRPVASSHQLRRTRASLLISLQATSQSLFDRAKITGPRVELKNIPPQYERLTRSFPLLQWSGCNLASESSTELPWAPGVDSRPAPKRAPL